MQAMIETAERIERVRSRGRDVVLLRGGEADPSPGDWRDHLLEPLRTIHGVAAVGARRLDGEGRLFSMGEMVIHPKGFHHVGRGLDAGALRFLEEVDAVCGGVLAIDEAPFRAAGGEAILRSAEDPAIAWVELCLRVRAAGGRVVSTPAVSIVDTRAPRPTAPGRAAFRDRLGFDCLAADLAEVRRRHGGSGLLWNTRFHGPALPYAKYDQRGPLHHESYRTVEPYRRRADHLVSLVLQLAPRGPILDIGCGDGLFAHLLAARGLDVVGLDAEPAAIDLAARAGEDSPPGSCPTFVCGRAEAMPFGDGHFAALLMFDVIEHLPNPVAVLRECRRVLAPGGQLLLSTPQWQHGAWSDPVYHVCEFTEPELRALLENAAGLETVASGRIGGVYRDLCVAARRS